MTRLVALLAALALTGCTFLTGVEARNEPCTLARAGADTASGVVVNARGDTAVVATVGWCRP